MISDRHLAACAAAAYVAVPRWFRDDVHACASAEGTATIVAFRGTQDVRDWLRDFDALPCEDPDLGFCHAGFLSGVIGVEGQMRQDLRSCRPIVTGHSLGGALALIFAPKLIAAGQPPQAVVTFGAPRPGFAKLRQVLSAVTELRLYRCGADPVPEVPEWPYVDAGPRVEIGKPTLDPFADHAIAGYIAVLR